MRHRNMVCAAVAALILSGVALGAASAARPRRATRCGASCQRALGRVDSRSSRLARDKGAPLEGASSASVSEQR